MSGSIEVVIAIAAVMFAGIFRGFSGFGTGMILVPSLSILYEPVVAVCTVILLELVSVAQLVKTSLPHCHWRSVIPMTIVSSFAVPFGALLLLNIDENLMRMVIAMVVIASVIILSTGWRYKGALNIKISAITGLSSGLITGATSLGGLPVILYYLSSYLNTQVARASIIVFLMSTSLVSLITFASHGMITSDLVSRTAALVPVFIIGVWLGGKLFGRISESIFRKVTLSLLGGVSVMMLMTLYRI